MTSTQNQPQQPLRLWLASHPRTASNLFLRLLEATEKIEQKRYACVDAFFRGPERQTGKGGKTIPLLSDDNTATMTYQRALDEYQMWLVETEAKGKIPLIKEHTCLITPSATINAYINDYRDTKPSPVVVDNMIDVRETNSRNLLFPVANHTVFPDRFLATLTPIIIIRHPAKIAYSYARVDRALGLQPSVDPDYPMVVSMKWQRMIYDFYAAFFAANPRSDEDRKAITPVVIDGDRLVANTRYQMEELCRRLGLDTSVVAYSWEAIDIPYDNDGARAYIEKVCKSTGVIHDPDALKPIDIEQEAKKWAEEWDEQSAARMKRCVEEAMDDYEYLLKRSI
ncbi:hypothetical protein Moror_16493 [Moniliophthora roreri MCA 2997]|uniref:P-loop containing nucleoside triphosphate hydrolase protein n=1 Tax=Moniliophthora roreri (strain MCA 2997) TaxID=1381753 RepID=V2XEC1_MONRO|nr:hypothetical protein Moror_16493 [Moniliophthora roreri MCA 2997]KAI3604395.1 hypothetical protein WG66_008518 [Moniliophthora roreri]